jgi:hypothetical protein
MHESGSADSEERDGTTESSATLVDTGSATASSDGASEFREVTRPPGSPPTSPRVLWL